MVAFNLSKTRNLLAMLLMFSGIVLGTACSKDKDDDNNGDDNGSEVVGGISGDLSTITLEEGKTYEVTGDLIVPEGKSVTIPAGVTFEFQEGQFEEAWFIEVNGSLYVMGQADKRVVFKPSAALLASNKNAGIGQLWGGIIATNLAGDLVIQYADILHAGGPVREENVMAQPLTGGGGELKAGDASYALYYIRQRDMRQDGIFVLLNSRISFTPDDAIRINGGKTLMAYNVFEVTGGTGGDAVNIKAGTSGDFGFNLFYNLATNGLKSADTGPGERNKVETNFYNNTILNSGYRRAEAGRGAGLNYESNSYGKCYNNLLVNNRFGLRLVAGETRPNMEKTFYGHNWYYGSVQTIVDEFYPTNLTSSVGLIGNDPSALIPESDVTGAPGENNPEFVNYNPSTFVFTGNDNIANDPLARNVTGIPANADFRLKSTSAALTGGKTDFGPVHANYVSLDSRFTFTAPAPKEFFGALGAN